MAELPIRLLGERVMVKVLEAETTWRQRRKLRQRQQRRQQQPSRPPPRCSLLAAQLRM